MASVKTRTRLNHSETGDDDHLATSMTTTKVLTAKNISSSRATTTTTSNSKLFAIFLSLHLCVVTSGSATKQSSTSDLSTSTTNSYYHLLNRHSRTRRATPISLNSVLDVDEEGKYPDRHILKLLAPSVVEGTWARKVPASHAAAASAAAAAAAAIRLSRRQSEQMPNGRVRPEEPPEPDCKTLRAMWRTMRRMNRHSEMNNDIPQLPSFLAGNRMNPFTMSVVPSSRAGKASKSSRRRVMMKAPSYGGHDFMTEAIIIDPENPYTKFGGGRRGKVYLKPGLGFESGGHPVIITDSGAGFDLSGFGAFPEEGGPYGRGGSNKYRGRKPDYVVHHIPLRNPPPPGEFLDNPLSTPNLGGDFGTVVNSPEERALFKSGKLDTRNFGTKIPMSFGGRPVSGRRGDSSGQQQHGGGSSGSASSGAGKMILPGDGIGVFGKFGPMDDGQAFGHDTEHGIMKTSGGERGRKDPFFGSMVGKQHMDSNPGPFALGSTRYSRGGQDQSCARLKFKRCKSDGDCDCSGSRLHCSFTSLPAPGSVRYGKCVPFALQSKKVYSDDWGSWYGAPLDTTQLGVSNLGPRLRRRDPNVPSTSPEEEESVETGQSQDTSRSQSQDTSRSQSQSQSEAEAEAKIQFITTARLQDLTQRINELNPKEFWQVLANENQDLNDDVMIENTNQNLDSRFL